MAIFSKIPGLSAVVVRAEHLFSRRPARPAPLSQAWAREADGRLAARWTAEAKSDADSSRPARRAG
jgi:hypothetical protein